MIKLFNYKSTAVSVLLALSVTSCARFDERMQANGDFDYQNVQLVAPYQTGAFTAFEARNKFNLPVLTEQQKSVGYLAADVDIRPPTQFIPVIDGVSQPTGQQQNTKILFHSVKSDEDIKLKVWQLLESYLAENKFDVISKDNTSFQIETAKHIQENDHGNFISSNEVVMTTRYRFDLEDVQAGGKAVALNVELLSYSETNDDRELKFSLTDKRKENIELRFLNNMLEFAYYKTQAEELKNLNSQPLPIKLGFDDNHLTVWIAESDFNETWRKLPDLLALLSFEIIDKDQNLGYFSVDFTPPSKSYWKENNLNPFKLRSGKYYIQLGEMTGNNTSISWLDSKKKPLDDQKITDIYLSITEQVRNVLLKKDKQTKEL